MEVDSKSPLIQAVDSTLLNKFHPELNFGCLGDKEHFTDAEDHNLWKQEYERHFKHPAHFPLFLQCNYLCRMFKCGLLDLKKGRQWSKVCVHCGLEEAALVLVFLNSEGFCPVLWCRRWRAGRPEGSCSLVLSWGCRKEGGDHTVDLERCC